MHPSDALPALATARELHPSNLDADRPIGIDAIESIALGLASVIGAPDGTVERGDVVRHRVLATESYDAWIVTLGPQTAIEPHDHDGSIGVIAVTSGHLIVISSGRSPEPTREAWAGEFGLNDDGQRRSRLRHLVTGDSTSVGITHRHSLANPDLAPATTVQVFSPPLGRDEHA